MAQARDEEKLSENFGAIIFRLRDARQLTTREAASSIGISHSRLVSLEHGRDLHTGRPTLPSPELTARIAAAYQYPKEQLMILAGHVPWILDESQAEEAVKIIASTLSGE